MFFLLLATFDFYMSSCVLETLRFNKFFCLVIELNFHILEILISRFFLCGWLVTLSFHFHLSPFFYTNCEVHVNSEHLNLSMHDFACKVLRISRNIRAPVSRILKSNGGGDERVMLRCSIWCYDYRYVCVKFEPATLQEGLLDTWQITPQTKYPLIKWINIRLNPNFFGRLVHGKSPSSEDLYHVLVWRHTLRCK